MANAPADVAATIAQLSAEALAGVAYMQLYKPGTKCIFGQFTVSTSMKNGAPMAMHTGITAGANLMLHAGGWDEGGLVTCYAKLIVEAEQCVLYRSMAEGVSLDRLDAAMEAVRRSEP